MLPAVDPSFALLLATLRWPDDQLRREAIRTAAGAADVDWTRLMALANRHRAGPLLVHGLRSADVVAPPAIAATLGETARRALFSEMASAAECARLSELLAKAHVATVVLKGPALSLRVFGQLGLRTYRDLDLLFDEAAVPAAIAVLGRAGYDAIEALDRTWFDDHKDVALRHRGSGQIVELHWRLVDNRSLMPAATGCDAIRLGKEPLREAMVLADGPELAYLCLHGALHGWSRLRWLADVNALAARVSPLALAAAAHQPAIAQALILCRALLGARFSVEVDSALRRSWRGRALARIAWWEIRRSGAEELESVRFGSLVKNLSHYGLLDGWRSIVEELRFDLFATRRAR